MKRALSIFLLLLVIAGFFGAARLNGPLRDARREYGISQADPLVNAPPLVAFSTVALGGFRGIVADILWMRSARLQDEGRYFELVQLADWITKLEPRFTDVWAFHAWNLSYNISVLLKQPDERWRWVSSGISLLRDEGLRYNPGDARLLYELGWLFQHKIGGNTDSANMHYKQAWAAEMAELWDGPTPDFDFLIAHPDAPRAQRLRDRYKLDPAIMREIDQRYGPLDWRLPQAHAIYWGWQSRALAKKDFDSMSADRMIFQSLADAFRQGRLYSNPAQNLFILSPNPDLIPRVIAAYDDSIARFEDNDSFKVAEANFMREAIVTLYSYNRINEYKALFAQLRQRYPEAAPGSDPEKFVQAEFLARQQQLTPDTARELINGALYQSAFWKTHDDPARAEGFLHLARLTWKHYQSTIGANSPYTLPPLEEMLQAIKAQTQ